jgi:hypothetical protein
VSLNIKITSIIGVINSGSSIREGRGWVIELTNEIKNSGI